MLDNLYENREAAATDKDERMIRQSNPCTGCMPRFTIRDRHLIEVTSPP